VKIRAHCSVAPHGSRDVVDHNGVVGWVGSLPESVSEGEVLLVLREGGREGGREGC